MVAMPLPVARPIIESPTNGANTSGKSVTTSIVKIVDDRRLFLGAGFDSGELFQIFEELRQRDFLERRLLAQLFLVFSFVANVAPRLDAAVAFADERHGKPASGHLVVNAHRLRIENFDRVRLVMRVENQDLEVLEVRDLYQADDENVLRGKELMTAFTAARNFVEDPMCDESVKDLA
jgi:hypothetical protein